MLGTKNEFVMPVRKKVISYMSVLLMVLALAFCGCGKKVESVEKENIGTTESVELPVTSEILQVTEETQETEIAQETEESQETETAQETEGSQVAEDPESDTYGEYDLEAIFGPEQQEYPRDVSKDYIGNNLIETEYAILDLEDGVVLTQEEIDCVDFLCKTMEEVTGLSFLNGKYYKGMKVTFHIYEFVPSGSADNFSKAINIDKSCLQGDNLLLMVHELVHILQFTSVYTGSFPFYAEGHAEYWTFKIAEYILDNNIEGLVELVDLEFEFDKWEDTFTNVDITQIYEKNIDEWMDQGCYFAFAESWPAYIYGRFFFLYLEDVYGDANAFLPIYARIPYAITGIDWEEGIAGRKYMDLEPLKKMMMVAYSEDVFENFYPWLKEHEALFEPYK